MPNIQTLLTENLINNRKARVITLFISALLWSTGGLLIKLIHWQALAIMGWRALLVALCFPLFGYKPGKFASKPLVLGSIAYATMCGLFIAANKLTFVANSIILQYTAPVYVAVFSGVILREVIRPYQWFILAGIICGISLFFMDSIGPGTMLGNTLALISGVAAAIYAICARLLKDSDPNDCNFYGAILLTVFGLPFMVDISPSWHDIILLLVLSVFQQALPTYLYSQTIRYVPALEAMLISAINPILAGVWTFFIIGELPGGWAIVGGIIVFGGVIIQGMVSARLK